MNPLTFIFLTLITLVGIGLFSEEQNHHTKHIRAEKLSDGRYVTQDSDTFYYFWINDNKTYGSYSSKVSPPQMGLTRTSSFVSLKSNPNEEKENIEENNEEVVEESSEPASSETTESSTTDSSSSGDSGGSSD